MRSPPAPNAYVRSSPQSPPVQWRRMYVALTRAVPPTIGDCELTHITREPIDVSKAVAEHGRYEALLRELGVRVERVEAAPAHADSVFIEDTAVVFDEVAVIARPGAASRRGEVQAVAAALGELPHPAGDRPAGHSGRRGRVDHRPSRFRRSVTSHQCRWRASARRNPRAARLHGDCRGGRALSSPEDRGQRRVGAV